VVVGLWGAYFAGDCAIQTFESFANPLALTRLPPFIAITMALYIGSRISVVSHNHVRYEGQLVAIDQEQKTIHLAQGP